MGDSGERARERRAILWGGALFAAAALVGHLLAPGADIVWLLLLIFAVAAVPQALIRSSGNHVRRDRRRR
jgi:hypothetical protein